MIKQTWRKTQPPKAPVMVPLDQVKAAVTLSAHNATAFTIQMCQEQMLLTMHDTFGFGRKRCMRLLEAFQTRMAQWQASVEEECDAETFHMNYRQRQAHRTELAFVWETHDKALEPLVDPAVWRPYLERYKGFGGTGAWCE